MEGAGALTVQTKVLSEGLGDAELEALIDEVADRPRVTGEIAGREALVRCVEEGEVLALTQDDRDLLPLVLGQVDAGGVVGAGVQDDNGAGWSFAQGTEHAVEVETFGFGGEVGVVGELEADVGEDLVVVGPGGAGEIDLGGYGVELGQEQCAQVQCASS